MPQSAQRFVIVAVVLGVIGGVVALTNRSKAPAPSARATTTVVPTGLNCLPLPKKIAMPSYYPKDLPLPRGTYAVESPPATGSTRRIIVVVPTSLRDFVKFALDQWPKNGWALGRGEAEPGEAEDQFAKASEGRYGAFRARSIFCDVDKTWMLLVLGQRNVTASPTGTPTRTVTPSPLVSGSP